MLYNVIIKIFWSEMLWTKCHSLPTKFIVEGEKIHLWILNL